MGHVIIRCGSFDFSIQDFECELDLANCMSQNCDAARPLLLLLSLSKKPLVKNMPLHIINSQHKLLYLPALQSL